MKILGIDEAGRGPVIGPLVVCGYLIDEKKQPALRKLRVKDSKQLTPEKRSELAPLLQSLATQYKLSVISAQEIDSYRDVSNLNKLEIKKMQELINALKPDQVIIDAPEVNTKVFSNKVRAGIDDRSIDIIAENFADATYPEVSAASILAKVTRDHEIEELHKTYGFFGSGYTSDERTITFLKDWIKVNKEFPSFVRSSWITAQLMVQDKQQATLERFTGD
ncbi:MAG: ribonuclease HII [Candidatus Aenigmarchaeota archaeon]|nr:ribonuclease HII [Candidatus Aenigmarchaeota archaeon]